LIPKTELARRKRKWDSQRVLESIRLRHQEGKPLNFTAVHADFNGLICAARHYFGSWPNALAAAGIDPEQTPRGRRGQKG
jgi:hypothetical protein